MTVEIVCEVCGGTAATTVADADGRLSWGPTVHDCTRLTREETDDQQARR